MRRFIMGGAVLITIGVGAAIAQTGSGTMDVERIQLPRSVLADGKPLPAGTYLVRLTGEFARPAAGQSVDGERWVEFLKGGQVVGRELAIVVTAADIGAIAEGPRPGANASRVEQLKGGEYVRIWIRRGGNNYIIHLPSSTPIR